MVASFEYRAATSIEEVVALLAEHGDDAKILAGGQSLLPLINLGLAHPSVLVDVTKIPDLAGVQVRDGIVSVGATTRHAAAERSPLIKENCPLLAQAIPLIGDRQVRNRGTFGGSISHGDPLAELPTAATCLEATMRIRGPRGSRDVAAKDFFLDYLTTALDPDEILTEIRFPVSSGRSGSSFQELVRRKGDFAIVAAAASVTLDDRGAFADVRLALAGVAVTPILAGAARASLVGRSPTPEIIAEAAHEVAAQVQPESDFMASAEYRAAMAEVFARRALSEATQRAAVAP